MGGPAIRDLEANLLERRGRQTRILIAGRTGAGKSSTINSILGADVAEVGDFEPTTATLHFYNGMIGQSPVLVIDTPGFCDARSDRSNDSSYVDLIKRLAGEIDLFIFVTRLDENRVDTSELDTLKLLTDKFSTEIWKHAVLALTHADKITRAKYDYHLGGRTNALRKALSEVARDEVDRIPFIPVTNERVRTPDRARWMPALWLAMLERMGSHGFESFVLATIHRLEAESDTGAVEGEPAQPKKRKKRKKYNGLASPPSAYMPSSGGIVQAGGSRRSREIMPSPNPSSGELQRWTGGSDLGARNAAQPAASAGADSTYPVIQGRIVPPPLDQPAPASSAPRLDLRKNEYDSSGTRIKETRFEVERGVGAIIMSGGQLAMTQNVIEKRDPAIVTVLKAAAGWAAGRVRKLFGW